MRENAAGDFSKNHPRSSAPRVVYRFVLASVICRFGGFILPYDSERLFYTLRPAVSLFYFVCTAPSTVHSPFSFTLYPSGVRPFFTSAPCFSPFAC